VSTHRKRRPELRTATRTIAMTESQWLAAVNDLALIIQAAREKNRQSHVQEEHEDAA
jgi:hypothetical protein